MAGRPISESPRDGTIILAEVMNYSGVPETGGHSFRKLTAEGNWWADVALPGSFTADTSILGWWPADTDPATLTLTPRTNWNFIPSNGSHGEAVYDAWCSNCVRERAMREDHEHAIANGLGCDILVRTMAYGIGDPQYPTEWTYDRETGEPKCTARVMDVGQQPAERCDQTIEMFQETGSSTVP